MTDKPTTAEIREQFDTWKKGIYHPVQYDHGRHGRAVDHIEFLLDRLDESERIQIHTQKSLDVERQNAIINEVKLRDAEDKLGAIGGIMDKEDCDDYLEHTSCHFSNQCFICRTKAIL